MKKKLIIIVAILILLCATLFSIYKFNVINPFSSCFGMLQILLTDKEYTVVQHFPEKVIFAQSDYAAQLLDKYMEERGFTELKDERMGSRLMFTNGTSKESVYFRVNGYYSKWQITKH